MKRFALLMVTVILLCGFTYGYRNNAQTGKPDLVATGVTTSDVTGFSGYTSLHIGLGNGLYRTAGNTINLQAATNSVPGALTAADHTSLSTALQPNPNIGNATGTYLTLTKNNWLNFNSTFGSRPSFGQSDNGTTLLLTIVRSADNYSTGGAGIDFQAYAGTSIGRWLDNGRLLIGTTTDNGTDKLQVNGSISGTSFTGSAAKLTTPRAINGVNFDGSANIQTATANTSDYATGTFVPTITFATPGDLAVTYSAQTGTYTRTGNRVTVDVNVATSAFTYTTASGNLQVAGLPFTANATYASSGALSFTGITRVGYTNFVAKVNNAVAYAVIVSSGSGVTQGPIQTTHVPTGTAVTLQFSVTYQL